MFFKLLVLALTAMVMYSNGNTLYWKRLNYYKSSPKDVLSRATMGRMSITSFMKNLLFLVVVNMLVWVIWESGWGIVFGTFVVGLSIYNFGYWIARMQHVTKIVAELIAVEKVPDKNIQPKSCVLRPYFIKYEILAVRSKQVFVLTFFLFSQRGFFRSQYKTESFIWDRNGKWEFI